MFLFTFLLEEVKHKEQPNHYVMKLSENKHLITDQYCNVETEKVIR